MAQCQTTLLAHITSTDDVDASLELADYLPEMSAGSPLWFNENEIDSSARKNSLAFDETKTKHNLQSSLTKVAPIRQLKSQRYLKDIEESDEHPELRPLPLMVGLRKRTSTLTESPSAQDLDCIALALATSLSIEMSMSSKPWQVESECSSFACGTTECQNEAVNLKLPTSAPFDSLYITTSDAYGHPIKYYSTDFKMGPLGMTAGVSMASHDSDRWTLGVQMGRDGRPSFVLESCGRLIGDQSSFFLYCHIDVTNSFKEMAAYEANRHAAERGTSTISHMVAWRRSLSSSQAIGLFLARIDSIKAAIIPATASPKRRTIFDRTAARCSTDASAR
jgi:hypothetical protein